MQTQKGLSATIGILIITVAIVVVGVAIYFVYQQTQDQTELSITASDRIAVQITKSADISGVVAAPDAAATIQLSVESVDAVDASITPSTLQAGGTFTVTVTGKSETTNAEIVITAKQGSATVTHTVSVNVVSTSANTNTPANTSNGNVNSTNTNTTNTNTATQAGHLINGDLGFSMDYSDVWGDSQIADLNNLNPVAGSMLLVYFENVNRFDVPGFVGLTAVSANYSPTQWSGTPIWFAGTVDPNASSATVESQIRDAGFSPYEISVVTIDGRKAIKMYYYRGLYSHYLDVAYLIPYAGLKGYSTIMLTRSIEKITDNEKSEAEAIELGKAMLTDLKNSALSDQAMRRFNEFETAVQSINFTQ